MYTIIIYVVYGNDPNLIFQKGIYKNNDDVNNNKITIDNIDG